LTDEQGRYFQQHFAAGRVLLFGPEMASGGVIMTAGGLIREYAANYNTITDEHAQD
jgi:hypothetical protein